MDELPKLPPALAVARIASFFLAVLISLILAAVVLLQPSTTSVLAAETPKCSTCHGTGVGKPLPANHQGRSEATCLSCHPSATQHASGEAPTKPQQQQAGPSPTPTTTPGAAKKDTPALSEVDRCMACHQDDKLSRTLESGEILNLYVDANAYVNSVHGGKLSCSDCHAGFTGFPHPELRASSKRAYVVAYYEVCKRCHFANYTKTLDSVHYAVLSSGSQNAPVCTDCHGAHNVVRQNSSRAHVSHSCGACHQEVYADYAESVHGAALLGDNNEDVPVCTTCHGVHNIPSASSSQFHLMSTDLCAKCHSDEKKMAKYGLSPNVVQSYLDDFHGKTVSFIRKQASMVWTGKPVCTDCHGVHDIAGADDPNSLKIKSNLLATCKKCHPDANENFPAAWLSHYQPSINKASIVYLVKVYYWILIPVMIGGLLLHILLDLWRLARNR